MSGFGKWFGRGRKDAPWNPTEFAESFAGFVRTRQDGADPVVNATGSEPRVDWILPGGTAAAVFMGNHHAQYQRHPDEVEAQFAEMYAAALTADAPVPEDGTLLAVLKPVEWLETTRQQLASVGAPASAVPLTLEVAPGLIAAYAIDTPQTLSFVTTDDAGRFGTAAQVHALALEGLAALANRASIEGGGGRFGVRVDGANDASLALVYDRVAPRIDIVGPPVIAIPARDELLIGDGADPEIVESLRAIVSRIHRTSTYPISARLYTWSAGTLVPLTPPVA